MVAVDNAFQAGATVERRTGFIIDGATGIIAIVLTILGLLRLFPVPLVAIATIAAGVGIFAQGLMTARSYAKALAAAGNTAVSASAGAWALTFLAGGAAVILGILALLALEPIVLVAIAAIVLGGAALLRTQQGSVVAEGSPSLAAGELVASSASLQALIGLSALVLGIVSLAGFVSLTLDLVAFLALGSGLLLSSAAFGSVISSLLRKT